ncbi:MAG TPA: aspartate 1-decarboxylase [Gammaproteobacteria bacterium]|nr:aspartate 1-decarboxylase [Gammaproteobacteria bacterium]
MQLTQGEDTRLVLCSKIHQARVTAAEIGCVGNIAIDEDLMERAGLWPYEKVLVVSLTSGARLETYVIPAPRDSGTIGMHGAAAHLIRAGEKIIIMGFHPAAEPGSPQAILVDDDNRFVRFV